jgi:hypothetical protein
MEIGRTVVQGQPGQKVSQTHLNQYLGSGAHLCHPSYIRKLKTEGSWPRLTWQKVNPYLQSNQNKKGWRCDPSGRVLQSAKPWIKVLSPVLPQNKNVMNGCHPILRRLYLFLGWGGYIGGTGVWAVQGLYSCKAGTLLLAKHISSPFCSGYCGDEVLQTIWPG